MVLLSIGEDFISATQQLRSPRSKQSKWANPQRTTALYSSTSLSFLLYLSLTLVIFSWLMTPCADCALMPDSSGSLLCKMNKCVLMGNNFISLVPICTGGGPCFQRSPEIIGEHDSVATLSDAHMQRFQVQRLLQTCEGCNRRAILVSRNMNTSIHINTNGVISMLQV